MVTPPTPKTVNAAKLVLAAIGELKDGGASKDEIAQYLETELSLPDKDVGKYLNKAIDNGIAFGAIRRLHGRYYLGEAMEATVARFSRTF
ncbi:linker histone H1 and H5 family [Popillia japonica]|uniref:Linker histone H1 and H5 family n=1 Tax=Popillia japonica TaxID=7064 RepID=A0AAW1MD32_POPJA